MKQRFSYKRVLLKLSGESLLGNHRTGVSYEACHEIAEVLHTMQQSGLEIAVVIGGGNIFRGVQLKELGMARVPADQIGMLATLINGIALEQSLAALGCPARVMSGLVCPQVAENYNWRAAMQYLKTGHILIFVGGTGNSYFTTDTAAALRASEIHAELLIKATKVDAIYDKDPLKHANAIKYTSLTYERFLAEKLAVMDATAVTLCMNSNIPILVCDMRLLLNKQFEAMLTKHHQGTLVR